MGFLDKIREVAEEMERLAATEEAARLERMNHELLRQMELTGLDQPGQGAMSSGWQPQGHPSLSAGVPGHLVRPPPRLSPGRLRGHQPSRQPSLPLRRRACVRPPGSR
jgi:hypothetical protein